MNQQIVFYKPGGFLLITLILTFAVLSTSLILPNAFAIPILSSNNPSYLLNTHAVITLDDSSNPALTDISSGIQKINVNVATSKQTKTIILTETSATSGQFSNNALIFTEGNNEFSVGSTIIVHQDENFGGLDSNGIIDTITVSVRSSDLKASINRGSIPALILTETDPDTGKFTGSFKLISTTSTGDSLEVVNGDRIRVGYNGENAYGIVIPNPNDDIQTIDTANCIDPADVVCDTVTISYPGASDYSVPIMKGGGGGNGGGGLARPGLVLDFTIGSLGGCPIDCTPPTLGMTKSNKRLVENGFSYNGNATNAELYYTPYPLITTKVGQQNTAVLKIYENEGPDNIAHVGFAFGLGKGDSFTDSKAIIEWDKAFDGTKTVSILDPNHALDNVTVNTTNGKCGSSVDAQCLIVTMNHTFREPLEFNMVSTNIWDSKRNGWQNYFNHGVEIVGKSLNSPKQIELLDNDGYAHTVTLVDRISGFDENNNQWYFDGNLWQMDYVPNHVLDKPTMHGIDRNNSLFPEYVLKQRRLTEDVFNVLVGKPVLNPDYGKNNNEQIEMRYVNRYEDQGLQSKIIEESNRAKETFENLVVGKIIQNPEFKMS